MADTATTPSTATEPGTAPSAPASSASAAPAQHGKGKSGKKKKTSMVTFTDRKGRSMTMPETAFQARLNREAAAIVRARLGVSIEEAEKIVKDGGLQAGGGGRSAVQATADEALRKENERLRRDNDQKKREVEFTKKKAAKDVQRIKDRQIESELRFAAQQAGVIDAEFAVELFARATREGKATEPDKFFASLKTSRPYLFVKPSGTEAPQSPVEIPATTAPPESAEPGEVKPIPSPAGTAPAAPNIDEMSPQEFAAHARRQYGFSPGS